MMGNSNSITLHDSGALIAAVARMAAQLAQVPGGIAAADLVIALIGIEDTQVTLLQSLKVDIELIRQEPFTTAMASLRAAQRVGTKDPTWGRYVSRAEEKFFSALSLAKSTEEKALIELGLGTTWLLLGHKRNAEIYLVESCSSTEQALEQQVKSLIMPVEIEQVSTLTGSPFKNYPYVVDSRCGEPTPSIIPGWKIGIMKFAGLARSAINVAGWLTGGPIIDISAAEAQMKLDRLQKILNLRDYLAFHNLVQYSRSRFSDDFIPTYLELVTANENDQTAVRFTLRKRHDFLSSGRPTT
jgi:hypothetical protein